jgi:hypothetical protein
MARHIFQACPVWIYTLSIITNIWYLNPLLTGLFLKTFLAKMIDFRPKTFGIKVSFYCHLNFQKLMWLFSLFIILKAGTTCSSDTNGNKKASD